MSPAEASYDGLSSLQQQTKNQFRDVRRKLDAIFPEYPDFGATVRNSLDTVRRALDEFGGSTGGEGLAISFNGGKDACVVLYLLLLVLSERDQLELLTNQYIPVVYFVKQEFPEIEAFMKAVSSTYGFTFLKYSTSYKDGMQDLVDSRGIKGIIMGQRRGDPWTESMEVFTSSSPGWAKFTRVNPALEWKFSDVWRFLRGSGLSYCVLYDQGYTSLGERDNTQKNEALRLPDGEYLPAYKLTETEEHLERLPRTQSGGTHDGDDSGAKEGGAGDGDRTAPPMSMEVINKSMIWGKQMDGKDNSNHDHAVQHDLLNEGTGSVTDDESTRRSSSTSDESESRVDIPPNRSQQRLIDGNHVSISEPSMIALQAVSEKGACVQLDPKEQGLLTVWVGESLRWLTLTVAMGFILSLFGMRRPGSPQ